ncbi:MAG: hypothetical protein JWN45_3516 [Acidobacteriaceae bacterium]|nr:hypothetical protein [Acidobacteriaceae bacterium]
MVRMGWVPVLMVVLAGCRAAGGGYSQLNIVAPVQAAEEQVGYVRMEVEDRTVSLYGGYSQLHPGTSSGVLANSSVSFTSPAGFSESSRICWTVFQVGAKGRGPAASYLIVQPPNGDVGVAIRDDAPFQQVRLCTTGFPKISLINNWDQNQVMVFYMNGVVQ